VLNSVLGTHFKIVEGYPGGNDIVLAMERGGWPDAAAGPGRA
jgi:hypothetical protein